MFEMNPTERKSFLFLVRVVMIVVAVFFASKGLVALKSLRYVGHPANAANTISINGNGEVFAVPDVARISFSVEVKGATVKEAQTQVTKKVNDVLAYLKTQGIDDKDIHTDNYSSYPEYEYDRTICTSYSCPPSKSPKIVGYRVNQSISIKVRDTDKAGTLLQGLGDRNVTNIAGPEFGIDDPDALQAEARKKAIDDARTKAEALAKDLGVHIVRITSFQESNGTPPMYYAEKVMNASDSGAAPAPELPKGESKITSNVTITYEIE